MPVPLYPYKAWLPAPLYWPLRAIRTLGVAFCFAGFWSCSVLVGWLVLPVLALWPGTTRERIGRCLQAVRLGFSFFHFVMRALRLYHRRSPVTSVRPNGTPADTAAVLIANHPTLCDVTSIVSLFPNVVAVARPGFANNVLLQRAVRACGFVPTGIHVLKDCEDRLRMGLDVLIFPEGTRSPVGSLQTFHRGAFELAARAKVPIVLLKLTCEPSALSKRLPIWKIADKTAVLTVEPFDIIDPAKSGLASKELCRAIEQRYREVLGYSEPQVSGAVQ
jgi:1-acyl-sn-glycerol-3-phosphate acyltransferase